MLLDWLREHSPTDDTHTTSWYIVNLGLLEIEIFSLNQKMNEIEDFLFGISQENQVDRNQKIVTFSQCVSSIEISLKVFGNGIQLLIPSIYEEYQREADTFNHLNKMVYTTLTNHSGTQPT